jgi:hypothetical protein
MDHSPISISFRRQGQPASVYFDREELSLILGIYGRMVAAGHWKDYAVSTASDCAVFSIYRRASERPEYSIIKNPSLAPKQGLYSILSAHGQILKRGKSLANTLKLFERKLLKVIDPD